MSELLTKYNLDYDNIYRMMGDKAANMVCGCQGEQILYRRQNMNVISLIWKLRMLMTVVTLQFLKMLSTNATGTAVILSCCTHEFENDKASLSCRTPFS